MNILEEFQNCPIEWKELGEVALLKRGKTITSKTATEGPYPVISGGQKPAYFHGEFNREGETITVAGSGAYAGFVMYWDEPIFVSDAFSIEPLKGALIPKFLYHYLLEKQEILFSLKKGSGVPHVYPKDVSKILIPIPPLEIQEKIVQTLDKMTEYVTELTSELTSRKKQYSFYRDKLLSFEDEVYQVEWKTLGEIAENLDNMRKPVAKGGRSLGIYPYYGASGIVDYVDSFIFDGDYLLISEDGANLVVRKTPIAFSISGKTWVNNHAHVLKFDNIINQKFVNYYLNYLDLSPYISGAAQPKLNQQNLNNIKIPYPSLEIQSRIVHVLDNFDTVCNDLNIGLPKEIELRQKQYEYFRDKLLTFVAEGEYTESRVEEWDNSAIIKLLQWVFGPIRVELGALGDIIRGNGLQKKDFQDVGVPCIHYGQIYTYYGIETERTKSFINSELARKLKKAKTGDLIVATTSENVEDVGKSLVWLGKEEVCIGGHSCIIRTEQNTKFLAYLFRTRFFQIQKEKRVLGTKVIELYPKNLAKIKIILPSLTEQERIVSILDNFNTLTNSLSEGLPKEIELRQKQYEYWREQLLYFNE